MIPRKVMIPAEVYHIVQGCTFHIGRVKDLKDPDGRGRIRVEIPSILGEGQQNWSNWAEPIFNNISTEDNEGDMGTWSLPFVNQLVMVTFQGGDYDYPIYVPGPPWQEKLEEFSPMVPKEAKKLSEQDRRKGTRLRIAKTEAGHSLIMDDNGKQEKVALIDWTGAGLYLVAPGKENLSHEKIRNGERRDSSRLETPRHRASF